MESEYVNKENKKVGGDRRGKGKLENIFLNRSTLPLIFPITTK